MDTTKKMPVLFVGHGSPMNIVLKNSYTDSLVKAVKEIPKPKAILVISAHWLTNGTFVTCVEKPKTIYDFYGFPEELYQLNYPSPGSPENAQLTIKVESLLRLGVENGDWIMLLGQS